jgi:voltage-gated potassium channel
MRALRSDLLMAELLKFTNSLKRLIAAFLVLIIGTGMLYDHFENKQFWDSLWWATVTATTVGYGDFYPHTIGGRIAGMILMWGMVLFIIPLIVAHFASKLIVNNDAWTDTEQEELKRKIREMHAQLADVHASLGFRAEADTHG